MVEKLLCGIDIGSSKIATIVGLHSTEDNSIRVIGFNSTISRGIKKGLIIDIDKATAAIEESVEKAERMAGHKINHAFVGVGGPHIASLNSHGVVAISNPQGDITDEDIRRVIEAARAISLSSTKKIIEVSPRDYVVDGQSGIKNPLGMSGVRLEVETHIITASNTNLKNIDRCLTDLGLANAGYIFSGLASSEAVLTDTEKELGVVVVDIGGGKTDFAIYVDGSLSYSASIPVGAKHITNDIAVGLRVSLDSAEKIKLHLSTSVAKNIDKTKNKIEQINLNELGLEENLNEVSVKSLVDEIIAPRLEEIFKLIGEEIEKSGFSNTVPSGLVITGGGALTLGMLPTGKKIVGLPIRIGVPQDITGLVDEILDPQYATVVGLILNGKNNDSGEEPGFKNFNRMLKDMSFTNTLGKVKDIFKQFIP